MKILKSPGKVNLGLWIKSKREDGYHEILTVFHTIDYYDRIFIKESPFLKIKTSSPNVPENDGNIIFKGVKKFEEWTGIKVELEIFVEKNIPVGAGLGGGSSNVAVVLKEINSMYGNPLSGDELFQLSSTIGADVPFFLKGGLAVAEGIGDKLTFFEEGLNKKIFIIYPNLTVKTSEIYSKVTADILTKKYDFHIIDSLLGDFDSYLMNMENRLGEIALSSYPQMQEVWNTLKYLGYTPFVSGSGSAIFSFGEAGQDIELICKTKGWKLINTVLK